MRLHGALVIRLAAQVEHELLRVQLANRETGALAWRGVQSEKWCVLPDTLQCLVWYTAVSVREDGRRLMTGAEFHNAQYAAQPNCDARCTATTDPNS